MIAKDEYMEICRTLRLPSYSDEEEEIKDNRLWSLGEILEQMSYQIRELRECS